MLLFLSFSVVSVYAQTGNFFLSHYAPATIHADNVCFDIAQDARGVMYFGTKSGVLQFDGRNWELLKGLSAVYSLQTTNDGTIFWGGAKGFGKIELDAEGLPYLSVKSDSTASDIFQSLNINGTIYFLSDDALYTIKEKNKISSVHSSTLTGGFTSLFELYGAIYVNTSDGGVFKVEHEKLIKSKLSIQESVVFSSRVEDTYVIGTSDNKLFRCNERMQLSQIAIQDQKYVDASVIVSGSWVNKQLLALGTLRGGVIFVNPITGRTQEIINYATGLPDNEVFALTTDHHQNIWVAHDYGFTRISPYMPFRSFSHYPGLQGNLLCAYSSNRSVYVGTSIGLFKLQNEDLYEDLIYYVDVAVENKNDVRKKKPEEEVAIESPQSLVESKKRGLFNFLRKNRSKENEVVATPNSKPTVTDGADIPINTEKKVKRVKRTERILRASQYVYKKVEGINAKITHLLEVDGHLIASGLGGVYEVNNLQSKAILEEPVRFVYSSRYRNILFASTYQDELKSLVMGKKGWEQLNLFSSLDAQINFVFEGKEKELWLCGLDRIYRLEMAEQEIKLIQTIGINEADGETTKGISWNDDVLFANTDGFLKFDRQTNKIAKIDSLPVPSKYFAHNNNILFRDQHGWNMAGKEHSQGGLQLLNLFQDLRFITSDQQAGDLWIISRNNELYKFSGDRLATDESAFPLFVKSVSNEGKKTSARNHINLSEDKSAVTFEIVQPDYIGPQAIEFRYMLMGMEEQWSEWSSTNNKVDFPYLPPGEYKLQVQSRNIFGQVSELDALPFTVSPPYWKQSWFYAMEFAILATFVLLSFRLNARYRIVSRILSLLTIILLIQFIQTVINATIRFDEESPVIDFIIQVFVALLILPVEGYLRNLMFRSLNTNSRVYKLIGPKNTNGILAKKEKEEFESTIKDY